MVSESLKSILTSIDVDNLEPTLSCIDQKPQNSNQQVEAIWPCELSALQWLASEAGPEEALRHYRRATRLQPSNPQWGLLMGGCLRSTGRYQDALALYKKLNSRFPENVECLKLIVKLCGDQGLQETTVWSRELQRVQSRLKQQERVATASAGSGSSGTSHSPVDLIRGGSRAAVSRQSSDGRGDSGNIHTNTYTAEGFIQDGFQPAPRRINRKISRKKTEEVDDDLPLPPE